MRRYEETKALHVIPIILYVMYDVEDGRFFLFGEKKLDGTSQTIIKPLPSRKACGARCSARPYSTASPQRGQGPLVPCRRRRESALAAPERFLPSVARALPRFGTTRAPLRLRCPFSLDFFFFPCGCCCYWLVLKRPWGPELEGVPQMPISRRAQLRGTLRGTLLAPNRSGNSGLLAMDRPHLCSSTGSREKTPGTCLWNICGKRSRNWPPFYFCRDR